MTAFDPTSTAFPLSAELVTLRYEPREVTRDLSLRIPEGSFTIVVGPHACGKSTLLRALSRLLRPAAGHVLLDGKAISQRPAREVARRLGLLPQSPSAPEGITAADLVARGRYPHQGLFRQWSETDATAVARAMRVTGTAALADRQVDEPSGGQRQRVWIAMVLAQETPILLLSEPTTFLDIVHHIELLDILAGLNREGRTVVAVLYDLNHACRYASHLTAMRDGRLIAEGPPREIVIAELLQEVFGLASTIIADPVTGGLIVVPRRPRPMKALLRRFATDYRPHRRLFALDFAWTALGLLSIYLRNAALQAIVTYWGHMLGLKIETEMRRRAFDHLQPLSSGFFDNQKTGHPVARLTKDLEEIGELAHRGPVDVFIAAMTLIGAFVLMLSVYPPLALITALILPLSAIVTLHYGRWMTRAWRAIYGRVAESNARIEENVSGIRAVKAFANEDHERALFARNNRNHLETTLKLYRLMAGSMSLSYCR